MSESSNTAALVDSWRKAMEGADDGSWEVREYGDGDSLVIHSGDDWRICFMATPGSSPKAMERIEKNAAWIARCSPSGISALLDALSAQAKELEEAREVIEGERWHGDEAARQRDVWKARAEASEAREAEMREALRPFADFCEQAEHFVAARAADGRTSIFPTKHFRLEHFRRARAVLSTKELGR